MTIQEQLVRLNTVFEKLHGDFISADQEKGRLEARYADTVSGIRDRWKREREALNGMKEEVLAFYRIAKDNSARELRTAGIPGMEPDMALLNRTIVFVNEQNRNDPIAGQIIDLVSSYLVYLEAAVRDSEAKEAVELQNAARQRESGLQDITRKKARVLSECEAYLQGNDIRALVSLFENVQRDYEITGQYFRTLDRPAMKKKMMQIGYGKYFVDVPQRLCGTLKGSLGRHFDEISKMVNCPIGFQTDSHEEITVEYTENNEEHLKSGIRALLLNYLRYFQPKGFRVSLFDYIHYNAAVLGPLQVLSAAKNSIIAPVPYDDRSLKQELAALAAYYRKVEARIGAMTVYEYNRTHGPEEGIPCRILIINRQQEAFGLWEDSEMNYLTNNAEKFGLTIVRMYKSPNGGSRGTGREKKISIGAKDHIHVVSDAKGGFHVQRDADWMPFQWLEAPACLPEDFAAAVRTMMQPREIGTKYFNRFHPKLPARSKGKRKPIEIPFAVDEEDRVVSCTFENELFAAYMMGASRSGKSTLLHTMISGIVSNYHPDEVELWLLDFKMLEFKKYVSHRPPHVRYLLLEKSEDLVFDILDQMTNTLEDRQYIFSRAGWQKLTDVPPDVYMPAIFVIIDEFAQMSQIIKETRGTGYGSDYALKLENLLAKGAALGFKFIFASQTYSSGVEGLTDTACKQIQLRFALKNIPSEIKETLMLSSNEVDAGLERDISSLPPYETLYKWRNEDGEVRVGRFRNMYTEGDEVDRLVDLVSGSMRAVSGKEYTYCDERVYMDKKPVLLDGSIPRTFASQIPCYKAYEQDLDKEERDEGDILIYAGVPCGFHLARPFVMCDGIAENILIAAGGREYQMSLLLSVCRSYGRTGNPVEIWTHDRNPIYRKYKSSVLGKYDPESDLEVICSRIAEIKKDIQTRQHDDRLIIVLGYEQLCSDMEILGEESEPEEDRTQPAKAEAPDMSAVMERIKQCSDPEEKKRIFAEYNAQAAAYNEQRRDYGNAMDSGAGIYDARSDLEWIIKRAPNYGVHFLFCFGQARDFLDTGLDEKAFQHKLLFAMSREDSLSIMGNRKANEAGEGVCIYSDGRQSFTMRPHLHPGIPCNGWQVDGQGNVEQKEGTAYGTI